MFGYELFMLNIVFLFLSNVTYIVTLPCLSIRFYALAAGAALLKYIEFVRNVLFAPKSLKVEYQGSQNTMVIGM
jgi:hypothetical protein